MLKTVPNSRFALILTTQHNQQHFVDFYCMDSLQIKEQTKNEKKL